MYDVRVRSDEPRHFPHADATWSSSDPSSRSGSESSLQYRSQERGNMLSNAIQLHSGVVSPSLEKLMFRNHLVYWACSHCHKHLQDLKRTRYAPYVNSPMPTADANFSNDSHNTMLAAPYLPLLQAGFNKFPGGKSCGGIQHATASTPLHAEGELRSN